MAEHGRLRTAKKPDAILILGPTGSGKTPLGEFLEECGLCGRRCLHFDFGSHLREIALKARKSSFLSGADLRTIRDSVRTGRLLEKDDFHIAEKILCEFIMARCTGRNDIIMLNGLPRHVEQAELVDRFVNVIGVVSLACSAARVRDRIRRNTGGDRAGRKDDSAKDVARRLVTFRRRTLPLLDHYAAKGVRKVRIAVNGNTSAADIAGVMEHTGLLKAEKKGTKKHHGHQS